MSSRVKDILKTHDAPDEHDRRISLEIEMKPEEADAKVRAMVEGLIEFTSRLPGYDASAEELKRSMKHASPISFQVTYVVAFGESENKEANHNLASGMIMAINKPEPAAILGSLTVARNLLMSMAEKIFKAMGGDA